MAYGKRFHRMVTRDGTKSTKNDDQILTFRKGVPEVFLSVFFLSEIESRHTKNRVCLLNILTSSKNRHTRQQVNALSPHYHH